jgi:hypothetical protein
MKAPCIRRRLGRTLWNGLGGSPFRVDVVEIVSVPERTRSICGPRASHSGALARDTPQQSSGAGSGHELDRGSDDTHRCEGHTSSLILGSWSAPGRQKKARTAHSHDSDRTSMFRSIGRGGMGEVYRGRDTRLNRTVAVKSCARPGSERRGTPAVPARGAGGRRTGSSSRLRGSRRRSCGRASTFWSWSSSTASHWPADSLVDRCRSTMCWRAHLVNHGLSAKRRREIAKTVARAHWWRSR